MNKAPSHNCHVTDRKDVRDFSSRVSDSTSKIPVTTSIENMQGALPVSKWGIPERIAAHNSVFNETRDRHASIRAYCSGNRWLQANARAVGNW